jgi:Cu2+-exporting ATPase
LALEEARLINTVIFDKTGTLTEGRFGVVKTYSATGWEDSQILALAAGIEADSEHPIARGIRKQADDAGVKAASISNFEAIKGRGIQATWQDKQIYMGGPRLLEMLELSLEGEVKTFAEDAASKAQSVVYLIVESELVAAFALADVIRSLSAACAGPAVTYRPKLEGQKDHV